MKNPDGSVWQWDKWQAGMALVDFTNPDAVAWFTGKLKAPARHGRRLLQDRLRRAHPDRRGLARRLRPGADAQLLRAPLQPGGLRAARDRARARARRSCSPGRRPPAGQQFPVHWGGDCESTFVAMAESLRGGLSLAASGFGYWSHDIGGFEGTPDPAVFKRWVAFGLLSSHSRLHGSGSYRVPWAFDDEAVDVLRHFTRLKLSLMPYLAAAAEEAHRDGRPDDAADGAGVPGRPDGRDLDRQYMLGPDVLVAPVMQRRRRGDVLRAGGHLDPPVTGEQLTGPGWVSREARLRQPAACSPGRAR